MTPALAHTPVPYTARLVLRAPVSSDWPQRRVLMASDRARFVNELSRNKASAWRAFSQSIRRFGGVRGGVGPRVPAGWPERELGWLICSPTAEAKGSVCEAVRAIRALARDVHGWDRTASEIRCQEACA